MSMNSTNHKTISFPVKLDFYWRAIVLYFIAAFLYAFIKGAFETESITIQLNDPFIILLIVFITISAISLFFSYYAQREFVIGEDYIEFKNRFRTRKIELKNIKSIVFTRETIQKGGRTRRLPVRIVKIKLKNDSQLVRFRLATYQSSKKLFEELVKFKQKCH